MVRKIVPSKEPQETEMSKTQENTFSTTSDNPLDKLYEVSATLSCIGALLQNREDLDAMATRNMRPIEGLSDILLNASDTITNMAETMEGARRIVDTKYVYDMSDEERYIFDALKEQHDTRFQEIFSKIKYERERFITELSVSGLMPDVAEIAKAENDADTIKLAKSA